MKLYLAGPLFTLPEREFNARLAREVEARGLEVWLPQEHEPREMTARAIFLEDVKGIDWADVVVANMDGPDPDSGTCWEVGYAYAKNKPIICYRTDFRNAEDFVGSRYNLMLSQSASKTFEIDAMKETIPYIADCIAHNCYYDLALPINGERYRHADK